MITSSEAKSIANLYLMHHPRRLHHVEMVAKLASELAFHYHVSTEDALIASYLHDITKYLSLNQANSLLREYYTMEEIENWPQPTRHSLTAMILAKSQFSIDNIDILNAILYHTTGRANMSLLEKIIYVSDYAEESREFETESIRRAAFRNLDEALLSVLLRVRSHLVKTNQIIMPLSDEAIQFYQNQTKGENE